ncbi:MAG: peptidoglycan DD-metalloendopeptidase family protein [Candidatus Eisenbacteria bacterium]|nr:peptidoglycan DD-metalloendopeptidase family protein [Candidatus Eisenbacteria bacterium]
MLRALLFFLSEANATMRRHPAATLASLVSMTAVLFVLGLLLVVTYNVRVLTQALESRKGIVVFLEVDRPENRRQELAGIFGGFGEVKSVRWIPREEALQDVEDELGGLDVDGILGDNPLPDAFIIQCRPHARDAATLSSLATEIAAYEGVEDVLYGEDWVESLDNSLATLRRITLLVGLLCAVAVVLVLGATLRLTLVHRQATLATMRIVGATFGYIRGPFLAAGLIKVLLSTALALLLLHVVVRLSHRFLPGTVFLPAGWIVLLILGAAILGVAGSFLALEPVLRNLEDRSRRRIWAVGLILILSTGAAGWAAAQPAGGSISTHERELARLKAEIETNRARIGALRERRENLQEMLARLEQDVRLTRDYLEKLEQQEARLERDLERRRGELESTSGRLEDVREKLAERVVDYYKHRRVDLAELLLSSESFPQLYARAHYLSWAIHSYRRDLTALAQEERALKEAAGELATRQARLARLRREKAEESRQLESRVADARREQETVERELAEHLDRLQELEAREARTADLLRELSARGDGEAFIGGGLEASRGRLPWPVKGRVVSGFGSRIHPRFKTRIISRGIDIASEAGTRFRAVAAGRVVYAEWLSGYGNCVILDHGEDFYTLYAHARALVVSPGETVARGDALGEVGATDSVHGAGLHFEIRRGAEALDPSRWLQR